MFEQNLYALTFNISELAARLCKDNKTLVSDLDGIFTLYTVYCGSFYP